MAGRTIDIRIRNFRTKKAARTKSKKQFVLPLKPFLAGELAIYISKKRKIARGQASSFRTWQEVAVPYVLILLGLSGAIYSAINLYNPLSIDIIASQAQDPKDYSEQPITTPSLRAAEPSRLVISKLGIDTGFVRLGMNDDGTMQVPAGYSEVGWYQHSPTPGEIGPSVAVGHLDGPHGPAVFWRLHELVPGDMVEIHRIDGSVARFTITATAQFSQDNFPTNEVYGNINYAGLRLITCGGTFDRQAKRYSHNTVIYASLVSSGDGTQDIIDYLNENGELPEAGTTSLL